MAGVEHLTDGVLHVDVDALLGHADDGEGPPGGARDAVQDLHRRHIASRFGELREIGVRVGVVADVDPQTGLACRRRRRDRFQIGIAIGLVGRRVVLVPVDALRDQDADLVGDASFRVGAEMIDHGLRA